MNSTFTSKIQLSNDYEIHKLKFLLSSLESGERVEAPEDCHDVLSIGGEHITWSGSLNLKNKCFIPFDFYKSMNKGKIEVGDILLVKRGATTGKIGYVSEELSYKMASNNNIFVIRTNDKVLSKFLFYYLLSDLSYYQIKLSEIGSAQECLNASFSSELDVILPPINHQEKIINFLDNSCNDIDNVIAKNKKLIELLEEKRKSLIDHVVTKGLDSAAPMKDSGIEWIGEIPKHWDINNLSYAASDENYSLVDGPFGSDLKNEEYVDEGIPIIQLNNIKVGYHDFTNERFITEEKYHQLKKHSIKPGNIVIAKMAEPVARATIVSNKYEKYTIVADCIKLACNSNFSNRYVTYSLNSYIYHEAVQKATGTTRVRINLQDMKKMKLLVPPIEEQNRISDYLDNEIRNINNILLKIRENIKLLEEYKASLIHHVVTGEIELSGEVI